MGNAPIISEYGPIDPTFKSAHLRELCVDDAGVQTGPFGSQLHKRDYVTNGTPIITVEHLGENRITRQNLPCVTDADKERLSRYVLREGDIVFSRVGSVDRRALVRAEENGWLFSGRCLRVRPNPDVIDSDFLSWLFGHPAFKEHICRIAVGATMPSLNTKILSEVRIYFPPLPEQRAIAHILGTLDDKIELNRKMNETLEAMARATFKSWFIDFDPVRAKAEGRKPSGMDPETAALFPNSFEDSPLGKIPKGWSAGTLGDICEVTVGGDWGKESQFDEAIMVSCLRGVDLEHLRKSGYSNAPRRWIKKSSLEKRKMNRFDVLVAGSGVGPCGRPLWINPYLERIYSNPIIYSNFCKRLRAQSVNYAVYLDRLLLGLRESEEIWEYANGTAIPNLDIGGLLSGYKTLLPSEQVLGAFRKIVEPIYEKLFDPQSRTLASIRDALLPKLLSGEIKVRDAEKSVEESV